MRPRFTHDCQQCRHLGGLDYFDVWSKEWIRTDMYFCEKASRSGSVLARYGHEGSEYASMPLYLAERLEAPFSTHGLPLYVATLIVIGDKRSREHMPTPLRPPPLR